MAERSGDSDAGKYLTISYAGFNLPWAVWIAQQVEGVGYETTKLRWDPGATAPLESALRDLLLAPGRVLLVLDDWYFQLGPRTREEWDEALRAILSEHRDRFAAVTVTTRALPTPVAALRPVDLSDLGEEEARRLLLRRLGVAPSARPLAAETASTAKFPLDPPTIRQLPRRKQSFTGRDVILEDIFAQLSACGPGEARLALHGPGGVGKTAVALEYAHRFGNQYDLVYWVDAANPRTVRDGLDAMATALRLPVNKELGGQVRGALEALRTGRPHRRWLVVYDGADRSGERIAELLPEGPGHLLITTRDRAWVSNLGLSDIALRPFEREESIAYARRRAARLTYAEADRLADAVLDLPLLVAQTSSWLNTNSMPPDEYTAQIRSGRVEGFYVDEDYPQGFQTAWSITLNSLREDQPAGVELLNLLAQFSSDRIPVGLVERTRAESLPTAVARLAANPVNWHSALARISDQALLRLDYQAGADSETVVGSARMHGLYHSFLRNGLTAAERRAASAAACRVLAEADPRRPTDPREWSLYAELIPQLEPTGAFASADPAVRGLVLNCIEYLKLRGEFTAGRELCEQALDQWRGVLDAIHPDYVRVEIQLGNLLRRQGRYREAEQRGRAVVRLLGERGATGEEALLQAENSLGGVLLALGALEEGHAVFEKLWHHYESVLGPDDPNTLQFRSNIGLALGLLGRYRDALTLHGEVLAVRERLLSREHPQTLQSGLYYAWLLRLTGSYAEAQSRQELNVRLHQRVFGDENPETLRAQHNLAQCLRRTGDYPAGAALMEEVVQRSLRVRGPNDPETLMLQSDWSTFLRQRGDVGPAMELGVHVLEGYQRLVGPEHAYSAGTLSNVGLVHMVRGDRKDACDATERAWRAMTAAVGAGHPWSIACALNLSAALRAADQKGTAVDISADAYRRAAAFLGDTNPLTFSCRAAHSQDLRATGRTEEADEHEAALLDAMTHTFGMDHPHTVATRRRDRPYWDFEPQPI